MTYAELDLLPQHIRLLADSGISPEVAKVSEFSRIARRPEQTTYLDIQRGRIPAINLGRRGLRIDLGEALRAFPRVGGRPE